MSDHDIKPSIDSDGIWCTRDCLRYTPGQHKHTCFIEAENHGVCKPGVVKMVADLATERARREKAEKTRDKLEATINDISGLFLAKSEDLDEVNLYERILETLKAYQKDRDRLCGIEELCQAVTDGAPCECFDNRNSLGIKYNRDCPHCCAVRDLALRLEGSPEEG